MTTPRVVAITGASAGVGLATALTFARRGDRVGAIARDPHRLDSAVHAMTRWGAAAHGVAADVADADAVEAAAQRIERELGPIDIWINNAMVTVFGPVASLTPDELARVTDVTYHGQVWGTMAPSVTNRVRSTLVSWT